MAGREQIHHERDDDAPDDVPVAPAVTATNQNADVDALLDEIDDVLVSNAEQFVRGFVQKGGQ